MAVWDASGVLEELRKLSSPRYKQGMPSFRINEQNALGVPVPVIRKLSRKIGKDHALAMQLWDSEVHEARLLAAMIAEPDTLTEEQMEKMVSEIDSWDICDNTCGELFLKTELSKSKIYQWAKREEEFVRRAAFSLIAYYAVHRKELADDAFLGYFHLIEEASCDCRNFVRKGVDWALRQVGKRNLTLNAEAVEVAERLKRSTCRPAKRTGSNSVRELTSRDVLERLKKKEEKN